MFKEIINDIGANLIAVMTDSVLKLCYYKVFTY